MILPSTSVALTLALTVPPSATVPLTLTVPVASSSTALTVSTKVSDTLALPSEAVTVRLIVPEKSCGGAPLKVRVAALNDSHVGSSSPLASVAV